MTVELTLVGALLLGVVVFLAAGINGVAGFGFALVGTTLLATRLPPATAVVFMILPVLAVNLSLARELSVDQLQSCGRRFWPLFVATLAGTVVGLVGLDSLPQNTLRLGLGLLSLAFVATQQRLLTVPGLDRAREGCFVESTPAMAGVGFGSGLLFGGTNVGVQLIAYVRSCDLSHGLFVGVIAGVFLGVNTVRAALAGVLGLYPDLATVAVSTLAALPALAGVAVGARLRPRIGERLRRGVVLGLLTLIGLRLSAAGFGVV
ncbi:MAG: putative permease [halophilic archaeon J07HB67]|nr:MAG: putative permease [halophilic archaeon J07HB67]